MGADLFAISGAQLSKKLTINDLGVFHEGLPPDFNQCFLERKFRHFTGLYVSLYLASRHTQTFCQ